MGFFSWNCPGCEKSVRGAYTNAGIGKWMSRAVALTRGGSVIRGEYDGYGRVDDYELEYGGDFALWHEACWLAAGSPAYDGVRSKNARDQGYFCTEVLTLFPPGHDVAEVRCRHVAEIVDILDEAVGVMPEIDGMTVNEARRVLRLENEKNKADLAERLVKEHGNGNA